MYNTVYISDPFQWWRIQLDKKCRANMPKMFLLSASCYAATFHSPRHRHSLHLQAVGVSRTSHHKGRQQLLSSSWIIRAWIIAGITRPYTHQYQYPKMGWFLWNKWGTIFGRYGIYGIFRTFLWNFRPKMEYLTTKNRSCFGPKMLICSVCALPHCSLRSHR